MTLTVCELEAMAIDTSGVVPFKIAIVHSYVSLPEGKPSEMGSQAES